MTGSRACKFALRVCDPAILPLRGRLDPLLASLALGLPARLLDGLPDCSALRRLVMHDEPAWRVPADLDSGESVTPQQQHVSPASSRTIAVDTVWSRTTCQNRRPSGGSISTCTRRTHGLSYRTRSPKTLVNGTPRLVAAHVLTLTRPQSKSEPRMACARGPVAVQSGQRAVRCTQVSRRTGSCSPRRHPSLIRTE